MQVYAYYFVVHLKECPCQYYSTWKFHYSNKNFQVSHSHILEICAVLSHYNYLWSSSF